MKEKKENGKGGKKAAVPFKLFWATTEDHSEDWFIVAKTAASAARLHADMEGYDRGSATAEFICDIPKNQKKIGEGWPSDELIKACGGKFLADLPEEDERHAAVRAMLGQGGRAVMFGNRIFEEGDIVRTIRDQKEREEMEDPGPEFDCYFCDVLRNMSAISEHEHGGDVLCRDCVSGLAIETFAGGMATAKGKMISPLPLCEEHKQVLAAKLSSVGLK